MRPKLSIITVNFNNNSGLSKTLESVRHQSFSSYEHIIIDAGSKDGSLETIKQYAEGNPHVTFWVSEPDKGIYDGMNKDTARPPQHFAASEQHQCGHRLYAILTCSHPILVHIYLDDADSVTQHFLHLLKDGVHHLAWLAPGGEEIDQDKLVT